ncbi:MAG TPA: NAD(P)-dependent oxidoreductase [Acidimicrobiia bacterium]|nr:NAD(P)-dependent oxidoreductase [Acidimicrobiia bacterium]
MTDGAPATVAVNLMFGRAFVDAIRDALPGEVVVASAEPGAAAAEILAVYTNDEASVRGSITPAVRWIHALSTGVDGFPFDAVGDCAFTCSRGAGAVPIAEWAMAMILAQAKRLPDSWVTEPPARWSVADLDSVAGRTLGLVGIGAIGTELARRALAFDMDVVAFRRRALAAPLDGVRVVTSLPELLGEADHVVVAAPATPATHHLLDADAFAAMKPGAHLVNIARGSLVDQDALLAALDAGELAAASLDVVDPEPLPAGHPLYAHPKVRVSAHISWSTPFGMARTLELFVENVRRYRAGAPLEGVVDVAAGY